MYKMGGEDIVGDASAEVGKETRAKGEDAGECQGCRCSIVVELGAFKTG
jgi:hypothetical protein